MAELSHPLILKMAGAYQDASFVYILLELKQGGDLNALCRHQKLGAE